MIYALMEQFLDHCAPEGRLYYILDTLDNCPYNNLKVAAVGTLKKQISKAEEVSFRVTLTRIPFSRRRVYLVRLVRGYFGHRLRFSTVKKKPLITRLLSSNVLVFIGCCC
jgi:hypothetical protein